MIFWRIKSLDKILETAEKKSLKRQLGPIQLTLLGIGAVIGTGIFVLTAEAAQKAFCRFRKCTSVYKRLFACGRTLDQLAVAA